MDRVDAVVVGAGVIGLAIGRALAMSGLETIVLESESRHGTGTSARNSGVIHAGLYYPEGSLKAQWCVQGRSMLYEYAMSHQVPHRQIGKLIVGEQSDEAALQRILLRAQGAGVHNLEWQTAQALREKEPALRASLGLFSPSTGIIDAHGLMHALEGDFTDAGGMVAVMSRFLGATPTASGAWASRVASPDGDLEIESRVLVNAAGLDADAVAWRIEGPSRSRIPQVYFAKGNYATLTGPAPFSRLIYPVPVPGGLGTHLTLDMGGQAQFGPDVEWLGPVSPAREPGSSHTSISYTVSPDRLDAFVRDVRRWWPDLTRERVQPGYSGVRPKLADLNAPAADFRMDGPAEHGFAGLVELFGMESPGLTSCLAIAQAVMQRLDDADAC
ncbi:MAG: NAD(P)/FAD-dependent oxidoreductase [Burkholderiaceae bacterium]